MFWKLLIKPLFFLTFHYLYEKHNIMGCSCKGNKTNQNVEQTSQTTQQTQNTQNVVRESLANKIKKTVEKYYHKNS